MCVVARASVPAIGRTHHVVADELAGCAAYEGVKLEGARCPKDGEDPYERKRKMAAAKKKKAGGNK